MESAILAKLPEHVDVSMRADVETGRRWSAALLRGCLCGSILQSVSTAEMIVLGCAQHITRVRGLILCLVAGCSWVLAANLRTALCWTLCIVTTRSPRGGVVDTTVDAPQSAVLSGSRTIAFDFGTPPAATRSRPPACSPSSPNIP